MKCKVGDLALVLKGDATGCAVECFCVDEGQDITTPSGAVYSGPVPANLGPVWFVMVREGGCGRFPDKDLMPIRPDIEEVKHTEMEIVE